VLERSNSRWLVFHIRKAHISSNQYHSGCQALYPGPRRSHPHPELISEVYTIQASQTPKQYFPGTFNGTHFTAVDGAAGIADFGKDHYADQFFYGIPGDRPQVSIDWASNWEYANYVPTGPLEGWQSTISLPRINYLANVSQTGYDLISAPYQMSAVMPSSPLAHNNSFENGKLLVDFSDVASNAIYLEMNITSLNGTALSKPHPPTLPSYLRYLASLLPAVNLAGGSNFFLNRGLIHGFENPYFTDKFSVSPTFSDTRTMSAVFDRSIFEVFLLGGAQKATITIFPEYALDTLIVKTAGPNIGAKVSLTAWGLEGGWKAYENANRHCCGECDHGGEKG
jgi:beta-fructofuranosidase